MSFEDSTLTRSCVVFELNIAHRFLNVAVTDQISVVLNVEGPAIVDNGVDFHYEDNLT